MAKSKNKRKQAASAVSDVAAKRQQTEPLTPPPDTTETLQSIKLDPEDLNIAADVLATLTSHPAVLKSKACRDIRTAVYQCGQKCTTGFNAAGENASITSKISAALADGAYTEARISLAEMRIRKQTLKLGALCRWVRDLDVVSGLAEQLDEEAVGRTAAEEELLVVLDSILRLTGPIDYTTEVSDQLESGPIILRRVWNLRDFAPRRETYRTVVDRTIFSSLPANIGSAFRVIETTPGALRKPPNMYPATLYTSRDNAVELSTNAPNTMHHKHPIVPNLHLIKDALSSSECEQIIAAAETVGFAPDAPVRSDGEDSSVLAHNFYWVVDQPFCAKLWNRVAPFVPEEVDGKRVRGVNRRFRVYRYVPGAEYRAHIDGAWPPSGISPDDTYIYDSSPLEAKQSSLFTFLIYLNDDFEAGETTFFLPSAREGSMNAYSVKPVQGSVAMFPHGETDGSLLHEGTGVKKGIKPTAKYVIRTDVEYDIAASEAKAKDMWSDDQ